ncbi:DUF4846 domain-containing protein [Ulvibacter antarcticus]|uniref:Uncharacterized protein DUF4846 n=1 Tax=Ulvibacter antarcticus TaxID=442714 RepID=A0A3L9YI01_9FLAO|nr:DUF4846 domain-containing protein [Ulvibacter antarcticus]RMA57765.1 uncharacterized protein DUF4846 [Ulvibacter antarcticus]
MKKLLFLSLISAGLIYLFFTKEGKVIKNVAISVIAPVEHVKEKGLTVIDRIEVPEDFTRTLYPANSFQNYIQNYKLKPFGAKIVNYDGNDYVYQSGHVGIFELAVPDNGLQQCADALIRIRAEYLWDMNRKDEIGFNFTSGHYCSWKQYAEGFRPKINANKVSFHKTASANNSKENFHRYLNLIFMYSGTQSLYDELPKIKTSEELQVGDMLVYAGSPGHIVMLADMAINSEGEKIFILAQGNTPAQSVHLLKNLNDLKISPWYELEMNQYLEIPTYYFNDTKFVRFKGI